ncbi:MAG: hypothetical protein ABR985_21750 [Methanotrichaceae archaeon]
MTIKTLYFDIEGKVPQRKSCDPAQQDLPCTRGLGHILDKTGSRL